jgi:peptide/nickel transport system permease protein
MIALALRRVALLVPIVAAISIGVFLMMVFLPGDPAEAILGSYATPENLEKLRGDLRLDRPLPERYWTWVSGVLRGDFGISYALDRPVADELRERMAASALLAGSAFLLATGFGLLAGILAAANQNRWPDRVLSVAVLAGLSTPAFWLGLVLMGIFAVGLRWLPSGGMVSVVGGGGLWDVVRHLALPAITLAVVAAGVVARLTRTAMLEVLRRDFVRTARAAGLSESRILWRHAVRNALPGLMPVLGMQAGFVIGGAVYVETIFQWPGLGAMLVGAISSRDILVVQGGVLVLSCAYVTINLLADLAQHALDPRLKS